MINCEEGMSMQMNGMEKEHSTKRRKRLLGKKKKEENRKDRA